MLISHTVPITFRGKPATLAVIRNDGYCWGRVTQGSNQYDVSLPGEDDAYDLPDSEAVDLYHEAAADEANVSPALSRI